MKIQGIRSVDIYVKAEGEGVVNSNGAFSVYSPAAEKMVNNHGMPKLKGIDPLQRAKKENGNSYVMSLADPDFAKAKLFISSECVRAGLFKDCSFGVSRVGTDNVRRALASNLGLLRGYLIAEPGKNFARKSPVHVVDFECENPGLVYNQGTNSRARGTEDEKSSMYSYFKTSSNIEYIGKASINIEDLQFIALENSLGRSAFDHQVSASTGAKIAEEVTQYLQDIAREGLQPKATFAKRVTRRGSISEHGDAGLVLNQDAIALLVEQVIELFRSLTIRQGKGYMQVSGVDVDYNESARVFRSEKDRVLAKTQPEMDFAVYYDVHELSDVEFDAHQEALKKGEKERSDKKSATKAEREKKKKDAKEAAQVAAPELVEQPAAEE